MDLFEKIKEDLELYGLYEKKLAKTLSEMYRGTIIFGGITAMVLGGAVYSYNKILQEAKKEREQFKIQLDKYTENIIPIIQDNKK